MVVKGNRSLAGDIGVVSRCDRNGGGTRKMRRWLWCCIGTSEELMMILLLLLLLGTVTLGKGEEITHLQVPQPLRPDSPPPPSSSSSRTTPDEGTKKLPLNMYPDQHGYTGELFKVFRCLECS